MRVPTDLAMPVRENRAHCQITSAHHTRHLLPTRINTTQNVGTLPHTWKNLHSKSWCRVLCEDIIDFPQLLQANVRTVPKSRP